MSTAPALPRGTAATTGRSPKRKQRDPFDVSQIASPQTERELLGQIIDLTTCGGHDVARQILDGLDIDAFTIDCGSDMCRAIKGAYGSGGKPTITDIFSQLRRDGDQQGIDRRDDAAAAMLHELVEHGIGTAGTNGASARESAAEVAELLHRRHGMLAALDLTRKLQSGNATPEDLGYVLERVAAVKNAMEGRRRQSRRLRVRKVSDIESKPIDWFWPQRFSCGALTIITGMPGATKSTVVMDIASRISNGDLWPDGSGRAPQGGVILFGAEDDPEKVVRPRLEAAAANLEMIRFVDGAEDGQQDWLGPITIDRDLELVREQLDAFPECRAIVFDPLSQYVECQENSNSETRAVLMPLVQLAQERNVAIIAIMHLNKKSDAMMIQRIAGASSYGQIARHIIFMGDDPDDAAAGEERRRAMIVAKNSYGRVNCGQLYRISTAINGCPRVEWEMGTVEMDAERLNPKPVGVSKEYQDQRAEAVEALRDLLATGTKPAAEVHKHLGDLGYSRRQIDYAAKTLGVVKEQDRDVGRAKAWMWSLAKPGPAPLQPGEFDSTNWPG